MCIEESVHIIFDEIDKLNTSRQVDDDFEIGLVKDHILNDETLENEEVMGIKPKEQHPIPVPNEEEEQGDLRIHKW